MKITPDIVYETLDYTTWKRGRAIAYEVKDMCGHRLPHYPKVYVILRDLEEEGFVEHRRDQDEDGPYREYRKITGKSRPRRVQRQTGSIGGLEGSLVAV